MKQLPVSDRTVFLDLNGVRAARGTSADKVRCLAESGGLIWVFNFANGQSETCLRFWLPELLDARAVARLKLDDVISQILPPNRRSFNGSEIGQWFLVSKPTVQRIGREVGGVVKDRLLYVQRERLVNYLRQRWIGAACDSLEEGGGRS